MNDILSLYACRLSCGAVRGGGDPQTLVFALIGGGSQKHLAHAPVPAHVPCAPSHSLAPSHLVKLSLNIFGYGRIFIQRRKSSNVSCSV